VVSPKTNFKRSATISSAAPLRHKDKAQPITKQMRSTFEALDLETLLSEFRAVAQQKNELAGDEEEEADVTESPSKGEAASSPASGALQWLKSSGLDSLAELHENGQRILDSHVHKLTGHFMPEQIDSVMRRVSSLNRLLKGKDAATSVGADAGSAAGADTSAQFQTQAKSRMSTLSVSTSLGDAEPCTVYSDLGEADKAQVAHLNLISLTSLLESAGLTLTLGKMKKRKKKKGETKVFGVDLTTLLELDATERMHKITDPEVPLYVASVLSFLNEKGKDEEGIFRKAGGAIRIRDLRERIDTESGATDFAACGSRPHDVAALLKQFLRDLPEPLLTHQFLDAFAMTQKLKDEADQLKALSLLVMMLPTVHQAVLKKLLKFLAGIAANEEKNKMGIPALAVVFAPSLFFVRGKLGQKMLEKVEMQVTSANSVKMLLTHHDKLWNLPEDILVQLRFVTELRVSGAKANKAKDVKKLLEANASGKDVRKRSKAPSKEVLAAAKLDGPPVEWVTNSPDSPPVEAIVSVGMRGNMKKVNIYANSTARTVLADLGSSDKTLHEQGGNIGDRRLHPKSKILPIFKHINPDGQLVVI